MLPHFHHSVQPNVKQLKFKIKYPTDFTTKIEQLPQVSANKYLAAKCVRSLYTNIPNNEVVQAVKFNLSKPNPNTQQFYI